MFIGRGTSKTERSLREGGAAGGTRGGPGRVLSAPGAASSFQPGEGGGAGSSNRAGLASRRTKDSHPTWLRGTRTAGPRGRGRAAAGCAAGVKKGVRARCCSGRVILRVGACWHSARVCVCVARVCRWGRCGVAGPWGGCTCGWTRMGWSLRRPAGPQPVRCSDGARAGGGRSAAGRGAGRGRGD
ncbi:MAG: hypothetical protein J3K34DRAFT_428821 [Monoraphidium minutum]|nr:MAG: hypothetical protein J3K34DRAFT_428821 [Monoraphidium minutum]